MSTTDQDEKPDTPTTKDTDAPPSDDGQRDAEYSSVGELIRERFGIGV